MDEWANKQIENWTKRQMDKWKNNGPAKNSHIGKQTDKLKNSQMDK